VHRCVVTEFTINLHHGNKHKKITWSKDHSGYKEAAQLKLEGLANLKFFMNIRFQ
jgi:hypothetical protein